LSNFHPILDWLAEHAQGINHSKLAVLHWDSQAKNIILHPNGSMVVFDWTDLLVSDPRFDLTWTLMLISVYQGSQWRQSFLEAYERHAGELLENLEFFDVAACTRRLYSIAVSISAGTEKMGMRPSA
jgi:aminoglycoside phosphotransferase (APT) family kinase protein